MPSFESLNLPSWKSINNNKDFLVLYYNNYNL